MYSSHLHPVSSLTGFVLWRCGFTYPKAGLKLPILLSLLPKYYRICHHTWLREYFSEIQSQHGAQAGFELPTILLSSPSKCWDFFFLRKSRVLVGWLSTKALAAKTDDPSSSDRTHAVDGRNQLCRVVLRPPLACHGVPIQTHKIMNVFKRNKLKKYQTYALKGPS